MELWWNLACDSLPFHSWISAHSPDFYILQDWTKRLQLDLATKFWVPEQYRYVHYIYLYTYIQHPLLHTMHYKGHAPQCMICITAGIIYVSLFALVVGSWRRTKRWRTYASNADTSRELWSAYHRCCQPGWVLNIKRKMTLGCFDVWFSNVNFHTIIRSFDLFYQKHQI